MEEQSALPESQIGPTSPLETELLARARGLGLVAVDGLTMLIGQAGEAFFHLFGADAPREHDAELRARLTA